jgi:hypothetical protein
MLPASIRLAEGLTASTSLGVSFHPGEDAASTGFKVGQALNWRARPRLNLLVEAVFTRGDSPLGESDDGDDESLVVSPGVQYAVLLRRDAQLVPGIAIPIGVGPSEGERAVMFYLSLEHPFGRRRR